MLTVLDSVGGNVCTRSLFVTFTPLLCSVSSHCASAGYERYEVGSKLPCSGRVYTAMCMCRSTDARPVHVKQYFRIVEPFTNRINLIRGPFHYIVSWTSRGTVYYCSVSTVTCIYL